jgi:hypothetical protein
MQPRSATKKRPVWNGDLKDSTIYRLPKEEQRRRKELAKSKNNILAAPSQFGLTPRRSPSRSPRTPLTLTPRAKAFSFPKAQTGRSPSARRSPYEAPVPTKVKHTPQSDELISAAENSDELTPQHQQAEKSPPQQMRATGQPQMLSKLNFDEEIARFESGTGGTAMFKDAQAKKMAYQALSEKSCSEAVEVLREVRGVLTGTADANLIAVPAPRTNQELSPRVRVLGETSANIPSALIDIDQKASEDQGQQSVDDPAPPITHGGGAHIAQLLDMMGKLASRIEVVEHEARMEKAQRLTLELRVHQQEEYTASLQRQLQKAQEADREGTQQPRQRGVYSAATSTTTDPTPTAAVAPPAVATTRNVSLDWRSPQRPNGGGSELPIPPPPPPLPSPSHQHEQIYQHHQHHEQHHHQYYQQQYHNPEAQRQKVSGVEVGDHQDEPLERSSIDQLEQQLEEQHQRLKYHHQQPLEQNGFDFQHRQQPLEQIDFQQHQQPLGQQLKQGQEYHQEEDPQSKQEHQRLYTPMSGLSPQQLQLQLQRQQQALAGLMQA